MKDEKHGFDEKRRQLNLSGCPRLPTRYKKSANYKDWCYKMLLHCSVHSRSKDQGTIKPVAKFPRNYSALTLTCQENKMFKANDIKDMNYIVNICKAQTGVFEPS